MIGVPVEFRLKSRKSRFGIPCAILCHRGHTKTRGHIVKPIVRAARFLASVCAIAFAMPAMAQDKSKPPASYPELPSEIPAKFKPVTDSFDHTRRKVMIPMRDDVKLHTVFLVPRGAKKAQDGAPKADIAPVTAFETGTNEWRRYSA